MMRREWVLAAAALVGCGGLVQAQGTTDDGGSDTTDGTPATVSASGADDGQPDGGSAADGTSTGGMVVDDGGSSDGGTAMVDGTSSDGGVVDGSTSISAGSSSSGGGFVCGDGTQDPGEECDDANPSNLDGCTGSCAIGPIGLSFGDTSTTEEGGGSDGNANAFTDDCPAGQVLTALSGQLTSTGVGASVVLGQVRGHCSELSLVDADPTAIASAAGQDLAVHGGFSGGGGWDITCPDGYALTGVEGRAGSIMDALVGTCTLITVSGSGGNQTLVLGSPSQEGPVGGDGGGPWGPVACAGGEVATGLSGHSNSYVVRVALRCREVALAYP